MATRAERESMPLDQAANLVAESLTASVSLSDTTLPVSDASPYPDPASGEYNVVMWDANSYEAPSDDPDAEIVRVIGKDTGADTLTVTRAQEGTQAASHPTGSRVPAALTAKMIADIEAAINAASVDISASDSGAQVLAAIEGLDFASNLTVTDDGDGTVTVDATDTDTDTRTDVSDDGTQVIAETGDINFASNLTVTDDGDGTVTVDATDTDTDTRTDVSDDGTQVIAETGDINFASNLTVTDDGDGTVTVDAIGGSGGAIALEEYATAADVPDPTTVTQPTIAYVADVGDGTDDYIGVFES